MSRMARPTPSPPKGKVGRVQREAVDARALLFFAWLGTLAKSVANFALMEGGTTEPLRLSCLRIPFFANTGPCKNIVLGPIKTHSKFACARVCMCVCVFACVRPSRHACASPCAQARVCTCVTACMNEFYRGF